MDNKCMTDLDVLGTVQALRESSIFINSPLFSKDVLSGDSVAGLISFDDLLKKDQEREKDGFPRKIKIRKILAGPGKVIMVPYVEEEKLIHGEFEPKSLEEGDPGDLGQESAGHGDGEVGDVIAEGPLQREGEGEGEEPQAGDEPGEHGIETEAYEEGKRLSEQFDLPNLEDKGKKVPTDEYIFDLTDRHKGSGQLLDKKATLRSIVRTNLALGRITPADMDPSKMIVGPNDKVYRVLSRERVWKSQAVVFFIRDYSGSMHGEPTRAVVQQHLMIYSWLLVQYEHLVIPRFIVHDTEAEEVSVNDYFRKGTGGGTFIPSAYQKVTEIVEGEALARDYNIYVFQGTDGDDFDNGKTAIPEIEKILTYVNRMGVCVLKHPYYGNKETPFEKYISKADVLSKKNRFRMHIMSSTGVTQEENIEAIKALIAQN